jgi:DNA polymerase
VLAVAVTAVPTIHPPAVLRSDDRGEAYTGLVSDLRVAASSLRR